MGRHGGGVFEIQEYIHGLIEKLERLLSKIIHGGNG
jgi:hypothetical protein